MKMYFNYISAMLKNGKKTFKDYFLVQVILVVLALISSLIAVYLMNYQGGYKAAIIFGVLEFVPIIGNGFYFCYLIIFNLIKEEPVIASNLAILYLTILSVRFVLEPILLSRKINFRIFILIILVLLSAIIKGNVGIAIVSIIIFILNTCLNINDVYIFERKKTIRERKAKREIERKKRIRYEYENLGEKNDNK